MTVNGSSRSRLSIEPASLTLSLVPAPSEHAPPPTHDWTSTEADHAAMFNAVRVRLREAVGEHLDESSARGSPELVHKVRLAVLECDTALGQLQEMLEADEDRHRHLEQTIAESQRALAASQVEERRVRHLASHDALTSLPNQRYFNDQLDATLVRARAHKKALALFYIDLDDFKGVNDQHGHIVGDELLRIVASRLTREVRSDDLVARIGGDEFACLLVGMPADAQLVQLARKLFDAISAPLSIGMLALTIRPSIGIGVWSERVTSGKALIEIADAAMYCAKRQSSGYAISEDSRASTADKGGALT